MSFPSVFFFGCVFNYPLTSIGTDSHHSDLLSSHSSLPRLLCCTVHFFLLSSLSVSLDSAHSPQPLLLLLALFFLSHTPPVRLVPSAPNSIQLHSGCFSPRSLLVYLPALSPSFRSDSSHLRSALRLWP